MKKSCRSDADQPRVERPPDAGLRHPEDRRPAGGLDVGDHREGVGELGHQRARARSARGRAGRARGRPARAAARACRRPRRPRRGPAARARPSTGPRRRATPRRAASASIAGHGREPVGPPRGAPAEQGDQVVGGESGAGRVLGEHGERRAADRRGGVPDQVGGERVDRLAGDVALARPATAAGRRPASPAASDGPAVGEVLLAPDVVGAGGQPLVAVRPADVEQPGGVGELQQPGGVGLAHVQRAGQPLLVADADPAAAQQPGRLLLEQGEQLADPADALQRRPGRPPVDRALLVRGDGRLGAQPRRAVRGGRRAGAARSRGAARR